MGSMKVHQLTRGFYFENDQQPPSLSLGCKRFRPLAPKLSNATISSSSVLDLKTFIRPESGPRKVCSLDDHHKNDHTRSQVETHPGGTRWNPTQEQIAILEMLYRGGMRTPNAAQIEQITVQLGKYGKIEGKNVFYWFQNHKARERQKQKRNNLALNASPTNTISIDNRRGGTEAEENKYKRKCRSWGLESWEVESITCKLEEEYRTLELFPLHPES